MPNLFARQTALSDVVGRIDYISNPLRQEHLLATYDSAADLLDGQYWKILAKECQDAYEQYSSKTRIVKNKAGEMEEQKLTAVEAREVVFPIANEIVDRMEPDEILQRACRKIEEATGQPVAGALQYNKGMKNLHIHVIYAERDLLQEPLIKVAERNLFFDAEGKRRYKKSEILDENKQLLPGCRIVKKGEVFESHYFSSVRKELQSKEWLQELKHDCILQLRNGELHGDVEITEYDPSSGMLPMQHVGNRALPELAARITEYNNMAKEFNAAVRDGVISHESAMEVQKEIRGSKTKNEDLLWYVAQIREILEEEKRLQIENKGASLTSLIYGAARRSAIPSGLEGAYWQKYRTIRDETWEVFIRGQRREFRAINDCREAREQLDFQTFGRFKIAAPTRTELREIGYYDQRDRIKGEMKEHKTQLATMRKYQDVAKGRQKIVRALILAGAEQSVIDAAMKNYEDSMHLLQTYTNDGDFENRRLKAAQWSLAQAQTRADNYIKKLEEEKLKEESLLEIQAETEYQDFMENGTVAEGDIGSTFGKKPTTDRRFDVER